MIREIAPPEPIDTYLIGEMTGAANYEALHDYFVLRIANLDETTTPGLADWRDKNEATIGYANSVASSDLFSLSRSRVPELEACAKAAELIIYPHEQAA